LLEGDFGEGDTIRVDAQNGDLAFTRAQPVSDTNSVSDTPIGR
jgi:hypothetical protein